MVDHHDMIVDAAPVDTVSVTDHKTSGPFLMCDYDAFAERIEFGLKFHGGVYQAHWMVNRLR
ncbi:hypothetical protein [Cupriavidus taiwanensis]|uniref:hypothetical protein n=1 Tax=Cupriavidus taiwanensis TaxID=164546 RepID=UPI000E2F3599|nr:hypothetical protein [Cupriavidus taiwanensis]